MRAAFGGCPFDARAEGGEQGGAALAEPDVGDRDEGALGIEHELEPWQPEPLPPRTWREARVQDIGWAREYLLPWVVRRIRHQSSGDRITAKRPHALPLPVPPPE